MGGALRRAARNWNVEHRAQKQIYKDGQTVRAAPRHDRVKEIMEEATVAAMTSKDKTLDDPLVKRISSMKIESKPIEDADIDQEAKEQSVRSLPQDRSPVGDFKYGHPIPKIVPMGKITIEQALEMLAKYKAENTDLSVLSKEYGVDQITLADVVEHFRLFDVKTPVDLKRELEDHRTINEGHISASDKDSGTAITDK